MARRLVLCGVLAAALAGGCGGTPAPASEGVPPEEPSPRYRSLETAAGYVGDSACAACHAEAAAAYRTHAMARSLHRWTPATRIETLPERPLFHAPTGFYYAVVEAGDTLYQEEFLIGPGGRRLHELRRRLDYVVGSGAIARTYFTEENGRLFQLPLTWYRRRGWDFSPGYERNNARFGRLLPDRCVACHGSYPDTYPHVEGKYAALPPGIGCERCHGPGALHARERTAGVPVDTTYDATIVNPPDLPVERRLDVCEQCHVHTSVTVLREGEDAFSYRPSRPLAEHAAFFKPAGSIDIVSHADRLRQSACFRAARATAQPLECATCHDPHAPDPPEDASARTAACRQCHDPAAVAGGLASAPAAAAHTADADCVGCHMPAVHERTVPHGTFTDHWIRVVTGADPPASSPRPAGPVEPYYARDRTGPDAALYRSMGGIVYATLASDPQVLRQAAADLGAALGADTSRPDAQFLLGLANGQLGRPADAIAALERSLRTEPARPEALHALAKAYEAVGRPAAEVAVLYERALTLQPLLAWIRADYADFLHAQGRRADAEAEYRAALAEQPGLDVAAFNLGTLLAAWGRRAEATEAFRTAVGLNPPLGEALAPLVEVRTMAGAVVGVRLLGAPLETLPVRGRGPGAVQVTVRGRRDDRALLILNTPRRALVRVLRPDGTVMRVLRAGDDPTLAWDLLTDGATPIPGGLYYVEVHAAPGDGAPPQRVALGIVRMTRS